MTPRSASLSALLVAPTLAFGVAATADAADFEVGPGDDFCQVFNNEAGPGDHVLLLPGTHAGPCNLTNGGAPGMAKVLRAADIDQLTAIAYDGNSSNVIDVNTSDVVIMGLRFGPTNPAIDAIKIKSGDRVEITANHFLQIGGISISANTTDSVGVQIFGNHFEDLQATGIYLGCHDGMGACAAVDFEISDNLIDGVDSANVGYGLEIKLDSYGIVRDNVIHDTKGPGIEIFGSTAPTRRNFVEGNLVIGSRNNATLEVAGGPTIVRNNVVIGGAYAGLYVYDYQNRDLVRDIQVVGNTVIGDDGPAIRLSEWAADKNLELADNAAWQEAGAGPAIPAAIDGVSWIGNVDCADPSACWIDGPGRDLWPVADAPLLTMGAAPTLTDLTEDFCGQTRGDVPHAGALERVGDDGPGALMVVFKGEIDCSGGGMGTTGGDTDGTATGGDTDGGTDGSTTGATAGSDTAAETTGGDGTTGATGTSGEGTSSGAPLGLVVVVALLGLGRRRRG